jgi:hypothetical protein
MAGAFAPSFGVGFAVSPLIWGSPAHSYIAFDAVPNRITAENVYLNFARAKNNINYLLGLLGGQPIQGSTIPLSLLNQKHDRDSYITACFVSVAADINAIINYINAHNL